MRKKKEKAPPKVDYAIVSQSSSDADTLDGMKYEQQANAFIAEAKLKEIHDHGINMSSVTNNPWVSTSSFYQPKLVKAPRYRILRLIGWGILIGLLAADFFLDP